MAALIDCGCEKIINVFAISPVITISYFLRDRSGLQKGRVQPTTTGPLESSFALARRNENENISMSRSTTRYQHPTRQASQHQAEHFNNIWAVYCIRLKRLLFMGRKIALEMHYRHNITDHVFLIIKLVFAGKLIKL